MLAENQPALPHDKKHPTPILAQTKLGTDLDAIVASAGSSDWFKTSLRNLEAIPKAPGVYCFVLPKECLPKERVVILHGRTFGKKNARRQLHFKFEYTAQVFAEGCGLVVYVGKAANLHGRVKAHLSTNVRATTNPVLRGLIGKPHPNVTTAGVEESRRNLVQHGMVFYFEHSHPDEKSNPAFIDDVGESFVVERDLLEIKLIAKYAPPFNLKAEH
jgi:hypothetical protein